MIVQKGKQRKEVSERRFRQMFAKLWNEEVGQNGEAIREVFSRRKSRTEFMLGRKQTPCEDTFLGRLSEWLGSARLELTMARGWYTLDAVYYQKRSSLQKRPERNYVFPACMDVIIEHENGRDVETEMWKLLMFRSPLKVLIFYDHDEADQKLQELMEFYAGVDSTWPEAGNTEYLFLVGNRTTAEPTPVWRYAIAERPGSSRKWRISELKPL